MSIDGRMGLMDNTSKEMTKKIKEICQSMSPSERMLMGASMTAAYRRFVKLAILESNPQITEAALRQELFLKFYGDDFTPEERVKILAHLDRVASEKSGKAKQEKK